MDIPTPKWAAVKNKKGIMYQAISEDKTSVLCFPHLLEQESFLLAHKGSGFAFLLKKYYANSYSAPGFLSHGSSLWWPHLHSS